MQVRTCVKSILLSLVLALAESRIVIEDVQESEIIILLNKHGHKESVSQQIYVDNGENFTLTCATVHSYADDVVNLRWFKTKKVALREGEYLVKEEPVESSNPLTLNFSPVDISDAGSYMCKHLHSNIHRSVYIKVNTPRLGDASVNVVITKIREDGVEENAPGNLVVWEGNRFTLRCKANSNIPALSKLNLISSSENGEDVFKESSINGNELKFDPVRLTDTGIYSCSDDHGNESKTVHITVKPHPKQGFSHHHDDDEEQEEKKKKHAQSTSEAGSFLASRFEAVQDLEDEIKPLHSQPAEKPNNRISFNDEEEKPENQKHLENEDKYNSNSKHRQVLPEKNLEGMTQFSEKNEKQFQKDTLGKSDEIEDKRNEFFNRELNPKRLMQGVMEKLRKFKPGGSEGNGKDKQHDKSSDNQFDKMVGHGRKPFLNTFQKPADLNMDVNNKQHMFDNVKPYVANSFLDAFENFKNKNNLAAQANRENFAKQRSENELNSEKMSHLENRFGNENIFAEDEEDNIQKPFLERNDAGEEDDLNGEVQSDNVGVDHEIKNQLNDLEEEFDEMDDIVEIEDHISKMLTAFDKELTDMVKIVKIPKWTNVQADKNLIKKEINDLLQEFKYLKDLVKFEKFLSTVLHELEEGSDNDWISFARDKQEALNELLNNLKSERFNGKNKNAVALSEKFDVSNDEKQAWHLADRFNDPLEGDIFDDADEFMQADQGISENQIPKSEEEVYDTSNREQESKNDLKMDIIDLHNKLNELKHLKEIEHVQNEILEKLDDDGSTENKSPENGENFAEFPNKIPFKPNSRNDVAESRDEFNDGTFFDNPTGRKLKVYSDFLKELKDCLEDELSIPKDAGVNDKEFPNGEEWDSGSGEKEYNSNENFDDEKEEDEENIPIAIQPRLGESEDFDFDNDYGRWHQNEVNVRNWKENSQISSGNSHKRMPSHFKEDQIVFENHFENQDDDEDNEYYDSDEHEGSGAEDIFDDTIKHDSEKGSIRVADELKQDWEEEHTSQQENPVENLNDTTHSTLIISGLSIAIAILSLILILRTWCLTECKKKKSGGVDDESKYTLLP